MAREQLVTRAKDFDILLDDVSLVKYFFFYYKEANGGVLFFIFRPMSVSVLSMNGLLSKNK
jgi:hypothetical protein